MARREPKRDAELKDKVEDKLLDLYTDVEKGFEAQRDRSNDIADSWDLYNCLLSDKQFYNGTSQISVMFIHDAVEARVTRFTNQVFPVSGRYIEVTTAEADPPQATQALLETYVRKAKLRTKVVPALLRNGDVEGSYITCTTWKETKRHVTFRVKMQPKTDGLENQAAEPVDDFQEDVLVDAHPETEIISDSDFLLLPAASNSIADALEEGGSVTIIRRWSKGKIKAMIAAGEIDKDAGEDLVEAMTKAQKSGKDFDTAKDQLDAAGIKERGKVALIYEVWTKLKVAPWDEPRLCRAYLGGEDRILSCKRNPYWSDRCPIIAAPLKKMGGTFKSKASVSTVSDFQILANDTLNEAADTSHFSAMPIVMTDPLKNPRVETMTLALAAVWETSPQDTQIVKFPELWRDGLDRVMTIKDQIFQTLGVNPSMIPQSTGQPGKKRSQAEMAIEQQVDLLTTADAVVNLEEGILTPLVQFYAELDHQFRDEATTIRTYGEFGQQANMERVEPIQLNERFEFRWFGVESARNAAQQQQQIAGINVIKGLGPDAYPGYKLNLAPVIVQMVENLFGPRLAPTIFEKIKLVSTDPMLENEMLIEGFPVQVNPGDDDQQHIQAHMMVVQMGDPHQKAREHIAMHMQQMQAKAQAQQAQAQGGKPGGSQGGGPRSGAQAQAPRGGQNPPGAIHKDAQPAAGVVNMPRHATR